MWGDFFDLLRSIAVPVDFMTDRPMNVLPRTGGVFDDVDVPHEARKD